MRLPSKPATRAAAWILQVAGVVCMLWLLTLPRAQAAAAPTPVAREVANLGNLGSNLGNPAMDEEGACEEIEPQELLECGSQYDDMLDAPLVLSLLRALDVGLTEEACDELLADLWSQQVCAAGSVECGKLNAGAPPGPPPKLGSSSASACSRWPDSLGLGLSTEGRLGHADRTHAFTSRDLQPPVPPPRLSGR
jgi:hypothetical protein